MKNVLVLPTQVTGGNMMKPSALKNALLCLLVLTPLCKGQTLTETWWGTATAPTLWGGVELTLSRSAGNWNASGRLKFQGRERDAPVSDLKVDGGQISFKMIWENLHLRFTGQIEGDRLRGTFVTEVDSKAVSGDWGLIKLTTPSASGRIELPVPTGKYSVGRNTFHWVDQNREETETKEAEINGNSSFISGIRQRAPKVKQSICLTGKKWAKSFRDKLPPRYGN